jgi:hypothetical protein
MGAIPNATIAFVITADRGGNIADTSYFTFYGFTKANNGYSQATSWVPYR